ncbi:MAG: hypothetical protein M3T55_10040 [Pseudomonadota bacterium]|nr:hypothetical protein [Pseudomonadota bacterium]
MSDTLRKAPSTEARVTIDGDFLREQARDAVHQFFRPITAPFQNEQTPGKKPLAQKDTKAAG